MVVVAFQYNKLPFVNGYDNYAAYFSEAGGIKPRNQVRVSGVGVGRVSDVRLEGTKVRVGFTVRKGVELGRPHGSGNQDRDNSGFQDARADAAWRQAG